MRTSLNSLGRSQTRVTQVSLSTCHSLQVIDFANAQCLVLSHTPLACSSLHKSSFKVSTLHFCATGKKRSLIDRLLDARLDLRLAKEGDSGLCALLCRRRDCHWPLDAPLFVRVCICCHSLTLATGDREMFLASHLCVTVNSLAQLIAISQLPAMRTGNKLTHTVAKMMGGIGIMDFLDNAAVAFAMHQPPNTVSCVSAFRSQADTSKLILTADQSRYFPWLHCVKSVR